MRSRSSVDFDFDAIGDGQEVIELPSEFDLKRLCGPADTIIAGWRPPTNGATTEQMTPEGAQER